jgi:hypothetical protein
MGLSFLAPLFFGGIALLAAPFLIHQIRRPERDPLAFSSILFIPNIPKEVIERRRLQHILLMLLRMLLFLLLALAFTRPYWEDPAAFDADDGPGRHLLLVDASYSMGAGGAFDEAKAKALATLGDIPEEEPVGVVVFGRSHTTAAPIASDSDPQAGSHERARLAIESAELTDEDTAYLPAMQHAQALLTGGLDEEAEASTRMFLHVISDFQKNGMSDRYTGWKLSPGIQLKAVQVEHGGAMNYALTDVGLKKTQDRGLRILGKVKNWSEDDADELEIKLFMGGAEQASNVLDVKGGNASQTSFTFDVTTDEPLEGHLALTGDGVAPDNVRYFTWNPPRKRNVLILADEKPGLLYPSAMFMSRALPQRIDIPWVASVAAQSELEDALDNPARRPSVIIASDFNGLRRETAARLIEFTSNGGQLLLTLDEGMDYGLLNELLLSPIGTPATGLRYGNLRESRYNVIAWLDFEHEIFVPFAGARFNDFSSLRFHNHYAIEIAADNDQLRVLARFDDDSPAIVEARVGEGRVVVWPFAVLLDWTNLPKTPRFVPILHQTLRYLSGFQEAEVTWDVAQRIGADSVVFDEQGITVVSAPGFAEPVEVTEADLGVDASLFLRHAGFFRTRTPAEDAWRQVDAVNVVSSEGDPALVSIAEFELKLSSAPLAIDDVNTLASGPASDSIVRTEYGRYFLIFLVLLLLLESWYMSVLKA